MIPRLYDAKEKDFTHNGIGLLVDTINCLVTEEQNGIYELELTYKVGSFLCDLLVEENIIKAKANEEHEPQLFRIYYISEEHNGTIQVKAEHISYDLKNNFLENIALLNVTCENAGKQALKNLEEKHNFIFKSDIEHTATYNISRCTGLECILNKRGSLLDTFGNSAKLIRDNFNISLVKNRGKNNNVLISYKKNITGYKRELDTTDLVTKIYPYAIIQKEVSTEEHQTTVEELIVLEEKFIVSDNYNKYSNGKILAVDYSNNESVKDTKTLRSISEKYFSETKNDEPSINYQIEFINLYRTNNYKNLGLENLEKVCLDDTVIVRDFRFNRNIEARVIKTVYNTLTERYEKIELGKFKNFRVTDNDITDKVNDLEHKIKGNLVRFEMLDDKIISEVSKLDGDIKSNTTIIEQNAESIKSLAVDINGNATAIEQNANSIKTLTTDVKGNTSLIKQTSTEINSKVSTLDNKYSELKQTSTEINSKVSGLDGKYSELKQTVDGIDITGMVTFSDLSTNGGTSIHGGNIRSNSLQVDKISSNNQNPIITLFDSCAIDATAQYNTGKGDAIRFKWNDSCYVLVNNKTIDFFLDGNVVGAAKSNGLYSNGNKVSVDGHNHNGYHLNLYSDSYFESGSHSPYYNESYDLGYSGSRWKQCVAVNGYFSNSYSYAIDNPVMCATDNSLDSVIDDVIIESPNILVKSDYQNKLMINVNSLKTNDNAHLFLDIDDSGKTVVNESSLLALALQEIKNLKEEIKQLKENGGVI